jgi:hypothetical protein
MAIAFDGDRFGRLAGRGKAASLRETWAAQGVSSSRNGAPCLREGTL